MNHDTMQIKTQSATVAVEKSETSRFWKIWKQEDGSNNWQNVTPPVKLTNDDGEKVWPVPGFETQAKAEAWAKDYAGS